MMPFIALAYLLSQIVVHSAPVPLTLLEALDYPDAKCLDGTQAGFYYEGSTNKKWVIYLNGGGECDNKEACEAQMSSALGSSKYFKDTADSNGWYIASDDCSINPDFCAWNHVFNPYCTQDLHSGQVRTLDDANFHMHFSGHLVLDAILSELEKLPNSIRDAEEIILSGASAGGIGVWMNLDYIAKRYPFAKVTGLGIASHYYYATYYNGSNAMGPGGMADFRREPMDDTMRLYNAYTNWDCKTQHLIENPAQCMFSNYSWPSVKSRMFMVQAQTDQVVLEGHDCFPRDHMEEPEEQAFMQQWHDNMTIALQPFFSDDPPMVSQDNMEKHQFGAFAAACYTHTTFSHDKPIINGMNMYQAFHNFYYQEKDTDPASFLVADDCGMMCNPTCPPLS